MSILMGFFGALLAVGLLAAGGACGWLAHRAVQRHTRPVLPQVEEQERRKLMEQQKAFHLLQNYTVEQAYGMGGENQ